MSVKGPKPVRNAAPPTVTETKARRFSSEPKAEVTAERVKPRESCPRAERKKAAMTVEQTETGGPRVRSYKDAALANLPPSAIKGPSTNPQLTDSLRALLAQHPNGVSLSQARRSCPLLEDPDVLKNYTSVRHLLASFPKVVRLQGLGVQTRVLPPLP